MAVGEPGTWSGRTKLESSRSVPPAGGLSMTISVRAPDIPITVSRNSPSMAIRPCTSSPSPTKNSVTVSRSATVMPMWSRRGPAGMSPPLVSSPPGGGAAARSSVPRSDAGGVPAEAPHRTADEDGQPDGDVDHGSPAGRVAGQRGVDDLVEAVHRRHVGDGPEGRAHLVQRHEETAEEGEEGEPGTEDLHDVLAGQQVAHEDPERREHERPDPHGQTRHHPDRRV